ncbi:hypothetical protein CRI94_03055 [Longibacter salinarum]|uniref:Response regulatory domain-containing protein n=1 Tax=Longibacter salinarum TaxID=1850348 RepID=A0A2A8D2S9_9BACT|nr:response regulator transcription factor [Longibacter salinarum]PEN15272.1 hypothetical protein CRI94_03055 [Longibacter salinarum]
MITKVFFVEDHAAMRLLVKQVLSSCDDINVPWVAESGRSAMQMLPDADPDVIVLDASLPDVGRKQLLRHFRSERPDVPVLICSGHTDQRIVDEMIEAGAAGYVVKGTTKEIRDAVRAVANGSSYVSPMLS